MNINKNNTQIDTTTMSMPTTGSLKHMGTWSYDIDDDIMLWSTALYDIYDVPATFTPSLQSMYGLCFPGLGQSPEVALQAALSGTGGFQVQYPVLLRNGQLRWVKLTGCVYVRGGKPARLVGTMRDITDTIVEPADRLEPLEAISGGDTPDLTILEDTLRRAEIVAEASQCEYALFFFSSIAGEADDGSSFEGDILISELIERITPVIHNAGSVVQLNGDTLAVVAENIRDGSEIAKLAERLASQFDKSLETLGGDVSIGYDLDFFSGCGETDEFVSPEIETHPLPDDVDLIRQNMGLVGRQTQRSKLTREIHDAQEADQFVVAYQPKIDFRNGTIAGFEALIRWQHPVKGLLEPSAFHQALADPELENDLSDMILQKVIEQLKNWSKTEVEFSNVAVNLAGGQLLDSGFFKRFVTMTEENAILPSQLKFEIREDVLLSDTDQTISRTLNCIKQAGFSTALDDFGRGNVSWADISGFSVDRLKIDRSLVTNLLDDGAKKSLVRSIIDLAHDLDLEVTAEGIETASVDRTLKMWGCDLGQGFAYARPMLADAVPNFIDQWTDRQSHGSHLHLIDTNSNAPAVHTIM